MLEEPPTLPSHYPVSDNDTSGYFANLTSILDLLPDTTISEPYISVSFYDTLQFKLKHQGLKRTLRELLLLEPEYFTTWSPVIKHQLAQLYPEDSDTIMTLITNYQRWLRTEDKEVGSGTVRLCLGPNLLLSTTEPSVTEPQVNIDLHWSSFMTKEDIIQTVLDQPLDINKWVKLISGLIPSLMVQLKQLTLPPIESFTGNYSILLENINLNCLNLDSNHLQLDILPEFLHQNLDSQRLPSPTARIIRLKLGNVQAEARDAQIAFEKKVGFPKFSDEGLLDLIVPEDSLSITILVAVEVDPSKFLDQLKNLKGKFSEEDTPTKVNSGVVEDIFSICLSDTIKTNNYKSSLPSSETTPSNSPPSLTLEDPFSDYFGPSDESGTSKICLISPSTSNYSEVTQVNSGSWSDIHQHFTDDTWDGDLTVWPTKEKIFCSHNESSLLYSDNEKDHHDTVNPNHELFLNWLNKPNPPSSIIPLQFSERRLKATSNQDNNLEINSTQNYVDDNLTEHFQDIALHSPKLSCSDDNESLIVPSLPDFSPTIYTELSDELGMNPLEREPLLVQPDINNSNSEVDSNQQDNNSTSVNDFSQPDYNSIPANDSSQSNNNSSSEPNEMKLPFDLRSLVKVILVKPEIRKVHVKLHDTNRDLLYRFIKPFIDHIAKRQLESAIRAVIINFLREWLIKFLEKLVEKLDSSSTTP